MTDLEQFIMKDCDKIDPNCINAFVDFKLDPDSDTGICLDTSWGGACLDLTSIVKAAETCTTLHLSPEEDPKCLVLEGECENSCIHGDDLSRIISMQYLKDVDQDVKPQNGDIYMYKDGKFYTFNLQEYIDDVSSTINQLRRDLNTILERYTLPAGVPDNAKIVLGNINLYSDKDAQFNSDGSVRSLDRTSGFYGHSLYTDRDEDEVFG